MWGRSMLLTLITRVERLCDLYFVVCTSIFYRSHKRSTGVIKVNNMDLPHNWFFRHSSMHVANVKIVLP